MRASQYLLSTLKESPAEAEIASHQLMIRAGMVRKLASGLYTWLPTGKRILNKVEAIVREEMDKAGAFECLATMVQPSELWIESGRYDNYGDNLLCFKDRKKANFVLGPTHEEVFTTLVKNEISSYRQLPLNLYQIQTKFRDETRPRFGILRTREFIMKDAYSFHLNKESLIETYNKMHDAYCNVFNRCGLEFRVVDADNGTIGGTGSKEFQVIASAGEDTIAYCPNSDYAANIEKAEALPNEERKAPTLEKTTEETPNIKSIDDLVSFKEGLDKKHTIKLIVVKGATKEHPLVAIALRGDHTLNEVKANNHEKIASPLTFADANEINKAFGAEVGSLGVVDCPIYLIADATAVTASDFATGANKTGYHHFGVNWERDAQYNEVADLRNVEAGDISPCGNGTLEIAHGIECGHIFQLGDKYSKALKCQVSNEEGKLQDLIMGCYGIGVSRIVAAAIEQNHDEFGICLPDALCPFELGIVGINYHKSEEVKGFCDFLYDSFKELGIDVILDDRGERLGVALADLDLISVPYQIIVGEKNLVNNKTVELKDRRSGDKVNVPLEQAFAHVVSFLRKNEH